MLKEAGKDPERPQRQAAAQHPGDLAARRVVPDFRGRAAVDGHGGATPLRPAAGAAVRRARDPFDRFISVLMFVPRERYDERACASGRQCTLADGLRRPGQRLLSQLSPTPSGPRALRAGRDARQAGDPDLEALEAAVRRDRPHLGGPSSKPAAAATAGALAGSPRSSARWQRRASRPAIATSTTPPRPWPTWPWVDDLGRRRAGAGPRLPPRRRRQACDLPLQAFYRPDRRRPWPTCCRSWSTWA